MAAAGRSRPVLSPVSQSDRTGSRPRFPGDWRTNRPRRDGPAPRSAAALGPGASLVASAPAPGRHWLAGGGGGVRGPAPAPVVAGLPGGSTGSRGVLSDVRVAAAGSASTAWPPQHSGHPALSSAWPAKHSGLQHIANCIALNGWPNILAINVQHLLVTS